MKLAAVSLLLSAGCSLAAWGASEDLKLASNLADLSLEQLTQITVTSASRRDEKLVYAPASIYVITRDDIRRSGATSIPEALRIAPNLHVARADTNQYAISSRGFNNTLANKMLVLIDGRTIYTPLFSGVFWEAQDVLLEDVDRIEVISGPGSTLWGANAVNGVINIITLPAGQSQGALAYGVAGPLERGAAVRHGGALGGGHYRAYLKYAERDGRKTATGAEVRDESRIWSGGFRADWGGAAQTITLQGDAYTGEVVQSPGRDYSGANLLARWTKTLGSDSRLRVQAYWDRTERRHFGTFEEHLDTLDLEAQHDSKPLRRHHLVWGFNHRHARDDVENSPAQAFLPADRTLRWTSAFMQDDVALTERLTLTLGVKAERNPYTGTEWLPNARMAWQHAPGHLVWSAFTRAVRAPSRIDRELFIPGNPPFALIGSPLFESEVANVGEIGYRAQFSPDVSASATVFHHRYPNLRSVRLAGRPTFANDIEGTVRGIEAWGSWRVTQDWRLSGGVVVQDIERRVKAGAVDLGGLPSLGNDPERSVKLRSSWSPHRDVDIDVLVRYYGPLQNTVPGYTSVDLRIAWRPTRNLELSVTAQNAADRDFFEWQNRVVNERNVFLKVSWRG
jgi:iron complex outermembrane recepter protein